MKLIIFGLMFVAAAPAADLPVKQVILYKHGVGYFERAGDLRAGESAKLDFKANEMNDVLKSLTSARRAEARSPVSVTIRATPCPSVWASTRSSSATRFRSPPSSISSRDRASN